jgi:transposase
MSDRSGLSRGDRNRNARLGRLRLLLPSGNAIVGIDLADDKQAAVVTDHDSRVIARRRVRARAWELASCWTGLRAGRPRRGTSAIAAQRARPGARVRLGGARPRLSGTG